jgi:hypothetical protein
MDESTSSIDLVHQDEMWSFSSFAAGPVNHPWRVMPGHLPDGEGAGGSRPLDLETVRSV